MGRIDYDKLRQLEGLLDEEVINEEEYNTKVAQICSVPISNPLYSAKKEVKKSPLTVTLAIISCALLLVCIYLYSDINEWQLKAERFASKNESLTEELTNTQSELTSYKNAIDNYLDEAVFVIEGDNTYYHRCRCSTFPITKYAYWIYNVESAKSKGYRECPYCFVESKDHFVKKHFNY